MTATLDLHEPAVPALWVGGPQEGSARPAPLVAALSHVPAARADQETSAWSCSAST
ncbi:hypothetical protein [Cellulomonas soli]